MHGHEYDLVIRGGNVVDGTGRAAFAADVAVKHGRIAVVGTVNGTGAEEIDARGKVVTPGFVDVHTHYDGQLTWSDRLDPSSDHGVTTVVTGNCGVGFAPCRPADRDGLVRLMEGVEDIPGAVMAEGLPWNWESFPDFLDAVDQRPHDIDFAVLLPHAPLRVYTMGERALALEPSTAEDRAKMRELAAEAMRAGAVGVGTSRNVFHVASDGSPIPTLTADEDEMRAIAQGMADAGRGAIQAITQTAQPALEDYAMFHRVARETGRPLSYTLGLVESSDLWKDVAGMIANDRADGLTVHAQIMDRPIGIVLGLDASLNPFSVFPYFAEHIAPLPLAERVAQMRKPEVRAAILADQPTLAHSIKNTLSRWDRMFPMGTRFDYEPDLSDSIAARAEAQGRDPYEVAYDLLLERDGTELLYIASTGFAGGKLDTTLEMMRREDTIVALGDGGAHYGMICDASYPTTLLDHWVKNRSKGERLSLPEAIHMLTAKTAALYGFGDRGTIAVGMKADLNVIDMDRVALHTPTMVRDLPAGGKRLMQKAEGFEATIVSGVTIRRHGEDTGARPGRLVRGAMAAPTPTPVPAEAA